MPALDHPCRLQAPAKVRPRVLKTPFFGNCSSVARAFSCDRDLYLIIVDLVRLAERGPEVRRTHGESRAWTSTEGSDRLPEGKLHID
jgi:hypothetical protein